MWFLIGKRLIKFIVPHFMHFLALVNINTDKSKNGCFGFTFLNIELGDTCWLFIYLKIKVQSVMPAPRKGKLPPQKEERANSAGHRRNSQLLWTAEAKIGLSLKWFLLHDKWQPKNESSVGATILPECLPGHHFRKQLLI